MAEGVLVEVLTQVPRLGEAAYAELLDAVSGPDGFDGERERVGPLSTRVGTGAEGTRVMLDVLGYLYGRLHADGPAGDIVADVGAALDELVPAGSGRIEGEARALAATRLAALLAHRRSADLSFARRRAALGLASAAREFETILDLRAVFSEDGRRIEELVPVVQLKVTSVSRDPALRETVHHLDRAALARLRAALDLAERQIAAVERSPTVAALVHGTPKRPALRAFAGAPSGTR